MSLRFSWDDTTHITTSLTHTLTHSLITLSHSLSHPLSLTGGESSSLSAGLRIFSSSTLLCLIPPGESAVGNIPHPPYSLAGPYRKQTNVITHKPVINSVRMEDNYFHTPHTHSLTHTHSLSHTLSLTHTLSHTHSLSLSHSPTHTHTHTDSLCPLSYKMY